MLYLKIWWSISWRFFLVTLPLSGLGAICGAGLVWLASTSNWGEDGFFLAFAAMEILMLPLGVLGGVLATYWIVAKPRFYRVNDLGPNRRLQWALTDVPAPTTSKWPVVDPK
jgi:biotin transporter BioY